MIGAGFPEVFEQRMRSVLGIKWQAFESAHERPSPVSIRFNPRKIQSLSSASPVPWTSTGFYLEERPSFTLDPMFHGGSYYVQEASSMFLEQAFLQHTEPLKPINVLDLCAAPGGKSTHILSLINQQSLLVSNEVIRSRAGILAENIQKWGYDNVVVTNNDPKDFQRLPGFFDVIVADAPCSGEGLFRKDPNAMQEWSEDNVALCARRQRRILSDVWPALKPGGILIYSTCTYNAAENEDNLDWLSKENSVEFLPLKIDPRWGVDEVDQGSVLGYHLFPHKVKGEGFFLSVIRKGDGEQIRMKHKNTFAAAPKKIMQQIDGWIKVPAGKTFIARSDLIQFFPENKIAELEFLAANLYILAAGTNLITVKHDKLIPEHALALSIHLNQQNFNIIKVDLDDALKYLRKETLNMEGLQKGFALIQFQGLPLGWVNVLENRINSLYPAEWRIRM